MAGSVLKTGPKDREQKKTRKEQKNKTKKDGDETEFMQHSSRFALLSLYSDSRYLDMDLFHLFCTSKPQTFFCCCCWFLFRRTLSTVGCSPRRGKRGDIESAQTTVVIESEANLID